jgi:hypothetical protein
MKHYNLPVVPEKALGGVTMDLKNPHYLNMGRKF